MTVPRASVALDCADVERQAAFWAEALGYDLLFAEAQYVVLGPCAGPAPRLVLQQVPEARAAKNRLHLDLHVGAMAREVAGRGDRGSAHRHPVRRVWSRRWQVMHDIEGNEFCVCEDDE